MSDYDYFLHYLFRLSENHLDNLIINSAPKGVGKSTLSIWMVIKYIKYFGYICPNCGKEFYKNLWKMKKKENGEFEFYIPEEIINGKWQIKCPDTNELDLKSGLKKKISGCGKIFKYMELKRIKWDPKRFIAYDNADVINKILNLPMGSPLVADEAINFACLTADTLIKMPRNMIQYPEGIPIKDLVGKSNFKVYSYDVKNNMTQLSNCEGCFYVKDAPVYEIELMTGEKIKATEDHKFYLMDGSYKQLKDLEKSQKDLKLTRNKIGVIKSIRYVGIEPVYSLINVENNHNYFANRLLVGNSSMDFAKSESKDLKKLFTVIRPKRLMIFFNIPEFTWLDVKYRENMATFWIRGLERGTAVVFERDKGEAKEKFHLKELESMMGVVKYMTNMDRIKRNLKKHPCYFDMIHWGELPEKIYEEYELVRNARTIQRQVEELELSNKDIAKIMAYNLIRNWDSIKIAVDQSKEKRITFSLLVNEVLTDPLTRKKVVSDTTTRLWVTGVENYIKSKGQDIKTFTITGKEEDEQIQL